MNLQAALAVVSSWGRNIDLLPMTQKRIDGTNIRLYVNNFDTKNNQLQKTKMLGWKNGAQKFFTLENLLNIPKKLFTICGVACCHADLALSLVEFLHDMNAGVRARKIGTRKNKKVSCMMRLLSLSFATEQGKFFFNLTFVGYYNYFV